MAKKIIAIDGESWCRNLTGIERLAIEVTAYLDSLVPPDTMELVVPKNAKNLPALKNIALVVLDVTAGQMTTWTQVHFQRYVITHHRLALGFANTTPFFAPGIAFIHDIYCKLYPADFTSRRDKLVRAYSTLMYRTIAKRAKVIFTVSEYTKQTIVDTYHANPNKIHVVYSGVTGYKDIPADESVFDRLPALKEKPFYFTLGSLSTRKNLKWICDHAALYPNETFAVSGKALLNVVPPELEKLKSLPNIVMTGYLSDGEVKALLATCRAFVFPTYFEGFGLPPLEALSCGAPIIVSNVTSLPEIYGKTAHYIDPNEPNVDLNALLAEPVEPPDALLAKYTLENTAKRMWDVIQSHRGELL